MCWPEAAWTFFNDDHTHFVSPLLEKANSCACMPHGMITRGIFRKKMDWWGLAGPYWRVLWGAILYSIVQQAIDGGRVRIDGGWGFNPPVPLFIPLRPLNPLGAVHKVCHAPEGGRGSEKVWQFVTGGRGVKIKRSCDVTLSIFSQFTILRFILYFIMHNTNLSCNYHLRSFKKLNL